MDKIVSFDSEPLILVDHNGNAIGPKGKSDCHDGEGVLHRALSVFVFNPEGEVLLQQRSGEKRLWPNFWSNSCCSHPRWGEKLTAAAHRRVDEELGMRATLTFCFDFEYHARFRDLGSEHEYCGVFVGTSIDTPEINKNEISDWRWISQSELTDALAADASHFTPWLVAEWKTLTTKFPHLLPKKH
ncbi:isopentenyl-diphosphate Delta-isomerase [Microbulbifer agarilyticus]|uniref:isopentenyl-diphosphate Delta-isomerase n=1 Tax=Microbulbifer agarilyticus TaxID=260552 RepID=UPI001C963DE7|nr:isopentenyl-diphosphate Delta-isomerase [Microbulbifer agarilyticus]MBY6190349.1 isopentenyl-diphosphate Delta-isomerase [Microbulbifer agarilyticus]